MAHRVSSKDISYISSKVFELVRKNILCGIFCDVYVNKSLENKESTREQYETAKNHLGSCRKVSKNF